MDNHLSKARFFDDVAERGLWRDFPPEHRPKVRRLLARLKLAPGMTVLEPGCGTGRLTARLLRRVQPGGRIIANDISPSMIGTARLRRLGGAVRWHCGPVARLRLRPGSVDRIVCFQSFPHFDDKLQTLRLFRRALAPDGLLAIVHLVSRRRVNQIHRGERPPICHDLIPTRREMTSLLLEAGLRPKLLEDGARGYWLFARGI